MVEPNRRRSIGTLVFALAWVSWAALFARSWLGGENGALGGAYYAVRDALQPQGYAIEGDLRFTPSWVLTHLAIILAPAGIALALHGVLAAMRRRANLRSARRASGGP